ncbi:MAG: AsmA family protein [Limisphaerales bacterium]
MKKWIFRSVAGLILILIVVLLAAAFSLGTILRKGVERIGPSATQVDVKLKSARVWLLAWRVELSEFVLGNPPGYKTPTALEVGKVTVRFKPGSLFSDKLVIDSIKVKGPVLTWEGGLKENNLKTIEKNLDDYIGTSSGAPAAKVPPSSPAKPERKLQINDLEITGAELRIDTVLNHGHPIVVPIPDIHLTDLGAGPGGITPVEVAQLALHAVLADATKEVVKNAGQLEKQAATDTKGLVKKAADRLKGLLRNGN